MSHYSDQREQWDARTRAAQGSEASSNPAYGLCGHRVGRDLGSNANTTSTTTVQAQGDREASD